MNCDSSNPKGNGIVDVWQEILPIRFGLIDKSDRLKLDSVFQIFQEAAISHAENLGVGRDDMGVKNQGWIISRLTVLVHTRPQYLDTITVRSWPRGWEKLFALRDYEIKNKDGTVMVSARSAWLIVDIEKRRPLRPQSVMDYLPQNKGLAALPPEANAVVSLEERGNLQKIAERKARYSDLDSNGHVNNARYIQWIEDTLDCGLLESAVKMRLDINYISEILSGETIDIMSAQIEDTADHAFAYEGRRTVNSQTAFRAELRLWEQGN